MGGHVYRGRVEEREQAMRKYALDNEFPEDRESGARVTQRSVNHNDTSN
jgi:hypothetical protein